MKNRLFLVNFLFFVNFAFYLHPSLKDPFHTLLQVGMFKVIL